MGTGQDSYCALCCGPVKPGYMPFLHPHPQSSSDDAHLCDRTSITEDHLAWLYDVRIIGRNSVTGKCYISGPAKVVKARRSIPLVELLDTADDDPPDMEQAEIINNGGKRCLYMYHMDHRHYQPTWQVPAHAACIVLLEKALSWRMNGDTEGNILDKEKLVRAIQAADPDEYARRLGKLNCFEFEDVEKDPLWQGVRGFEPWLIDPLDIPALQTLAFPPKLHTPSVGELGDAQSDPLFGLPVEIIAQIADYLVVEDMVHCVQASRAVRDAYDGRFWRRRLLKDMPYLYELASRLQSLGMEVDSINWKELYGRMVVQSYPGYWNREWWHESTAKRPQIECQKLLQSLGLKSRRFLPESVLEPRNRIIRSKFHPALLGIASRRRIWHCVEQLLDLYEQE